MQLKIAGAGHCVEVSLPNGATATVAELKRAVGESTGLAPPYQRLLCKGKTLGDDAVLGASAGVADGAKLILLHSPEYALDAKARAAIDGVAQEIAALQTAEALPTAALQERATLLLCKLDEIDCRSDTLRQMRRAQIQRCEALSPSSGRR